MTVPLARFAPCGSRGIHQRPARSLTWWRAQCSPGVVRARAPRSALLAVPRKRATAHRGASRRNRNGPALASLSGAELAEHQGERGHRQAARRAHFHGARGTQRRDGLFGLPLFRHFFAGREVGVAEGSARRSRNRRASRDVGRVELDGPTRRRRAEPRGAVLFGASGRPTASTGRGCALGNVVAARRLLARKAQGDQVRAERSGLPSLRHGSGGLGHDRHSLNEPHRNRVR
jgi:hypothetical protein